MGHDHDHHHGTGNLRTAFFLNLGFTLVELIGGIFTNSIAIMSDAVHDLGDCISLGSAWYFQKKAQQGRDHQFSYGYKRFSLLGAILNSLILFAGSLMIIREAIPRIIHPQQAHAEGMIYFAIFGMVVNGIAAWKMAHGKTMNERVVYLHLLEDVLGWVAVFIGAIVMYFFDIPVIDPLLSVMIAAYILWNVVKNLKKSLNILLQAVPMDVELKAIESYLATHPYIHSFHDLHVWSMDGTYNILTVHLEWKDRIPPDVNPKNEIKRGLVALGVDHPTIEVHEPSDEDCDVE